MNLRNDFKEIFNSAYRNKAKTTLSISGMAIGISIALLIGFWSINEFSYDKFHKDSDSIYRLCRQKDVNNELVLFGTDFRAVGSIAKEQFPEIEDLLHIRVMAREVVKVKETVIYEDLICATNKNIFSFFSFGLEIGNSETCLDGPDKIVIDRYLANKYFERENPIGQIIEVYDKKFQVSAVMKNIPENSHVKFHILIPIEGISWLGKDQWGNFDSFITYLKLKKNSNTKLLASQISEMVYTYQPMYKQLQISYFLQPLAKIHFSSEFRYDSVISTDRRIIFTFISLATLILLIATFNFINLFISTSFLRAKSIGIKMVSGSSKVSLFLSSYFETSIYILTATLLAIYIVFSSLPYFNQYFGTNLTINFSNNQICLYTGILVFIIIAIAGTIPVFYILRFSPVQIFCNRFKGKGITMLQRVLVVSQFVASIFLICSAVVFKKQILFVQNRDLGFDNKQLIYFIPRKIANKYESVREELLKNPNITEVTAKSSLPTKWFEGNLVTSTDNPEKEMTMEICYIKYNYPNVLSIPIVEGSNPFKPNRNRSGECMINEKAASALEFTNPVGKQIIISNERFTIAGVLSNANTNSLHLQIDPQVYFPLDDLKEEHIIMVKTTENYKDAIHWISKIWKESNPNAPFEYYFMNETYDKLYSKENTTSRLISVGMVIALFLSFMGLFAISHFSTERRVKEIGIRKINGAKISELMFMLNKEYIKWVIIAFIVATPIAYYAMHKWLEDFAYKTNLSWWIFALAGIIALVIALLTVSLQSWRAATKNPVEALRYE